MKKGGLLFLIVMTLCLSSCGGDSSNTDTLSDLSRNEEKNEAVTEESADQELVGLINPPYTQSDARYLDYKVVEEAFKNAGFINIDSKFEHMTFEQELNETAKIGEVASIAINNSFVNDVETQYSHDDLVEIKYYVLYSYDPLKESVLE